MKYKLYTKSHNEKILKSIDNNGGQFTAEEHAYVTEKESEKCFRNKETLLGQYLSQSWKTLEHINWLVKYIENNNLKNIISMGAGNCVIEYLLKCALPEDYKITATDFDSYYINKAKEFFPSINVIQFDFFKDKIKDLRSNFDLVIFFGSAYVMDDGQLINLFKQLKENDTRQIIDIHTGCISYINMIPYIIGDILRKIGIIKSYRGKFHGYVRTKNELRRLYKDSNVTIIKETNITSKYVAILNCLT
jgi:predicted RNA methylase